MVGHGNVLLDFLELIAVEVCDGVLLAVNSALLQSGVQLRRGHGSGGSAQAVPQFLMELVLHSTDLQAGHIGDGGNSVLAVGQFTEAVLVPGQVDDALVGQLSIQIIAHLGSQDLVGLSLIGKQEGDVENAQLRHIAHQRSGGGVVDLQLTGNHHLGSGGIVTQLSAGVDLNANVALGIVLYHGSEHGQLSLYAGRSLASTVGNLHNDGVSLALGLGRGAVSADLSVVAFGGIVVGIVVGAVVRSRSGSQTTASHGCCHGHSQQQRKCLLFHGVSS